MADDVRVILRDGAFRDLKGSDEMRDILMEEADPIVDRARIYAPKRTGAGSSSIRAEPVRDGDEWTVRISWTKTHYYMYFHNEGTVNLRAMNFLEAALEGSLE